MGSYISTNDRLFLTWKARNHSKVPAILSNPQTIINTLLETIAKREHEIVIGTWVTIDSVGRSTTLLITGDVVDFISTAKNVLSRELENCHVTGFTVDVTLYRYSSDQNTIIDELLVLLHRT